MLVPADLVRSAVDHARRTGVDVSDVVAAALATLLRGADLPTPSR